MTVWFVAAIPVLIMIFALTMERLEHRLRHLAVQEDDVEEFLKATQSDEMRTMNGSGRGGARDAFRLRLPRRSTPVPTRSTRQRA